MSDEKSKIDIVPLDFIFLDERNNPYRLRMIGEEYWICYLHPDKRWVTLRTVKDSMELWRIQNACIDWKHHKLYEHGLPFDPAGWTSHDAPRDEVGQ